MEAAAPDTASRGMTLGMDTSTVINGEISNVCETGKGHLARAVQKTGLVHAVLHTVYLRMAKSKDITST